MTDPNFDSTLDIYRQNLTEYKLTGNSAFKTAADNAKAWLDAYVATMQQQNQDQANYIRQFVSQYQNANPELVAMQRRIKKAQEEGPKVQDAYETEKQAQEDEPLDFTQYYVKAGLIAGLFGVVVVMSFL